MLEINPKLKYFCITSLHHFNTDALEGISESLSKNKGLKVLNLHKTSKEALIILKSCNISRSKSLNFEVENMIASKNQPELLSE